MVQIYIKLADDQNGKIPEWTIVEFQGDLETKTENVSLSGKFIGDLHFTPEGVPILIIGHHILYGKVMTMEKPLLVINKKSQNLNDSGSVAMETDSAEEMSNVDYSVKAVIKKKLLFKTRPKPIIVNIAKKV